MEGSPNAMPAVFYTTDSLVTLFLAKNGIWIIRYLKKVVNNVQVQVGAVPDQLPSLRQVRVSSPVIT